MILYEGDSRKQARWPQFYIVFFFNVHIMNVNYADLQKKFDSRTISILSGTIHGVITILICIIQKTWISLKRKKTFQKPFLVSSNHFLLHRHFTFDCNLFWHVCLLQIVLISKVLQKLFARAFELKIREVLQEINVIEFLCILWTPVFFGTIWQFSAVMLLQLCYFQLLYISPLCSYKNTILHHI